MDWAAWRWATSSIRTAIDPFGGKNGKWVAGYTVGAGGELKLNQNWSLRAEYRYLHFDVERD